MQLCEAHVVRLVISIKNERLGHSCAAMALGFEKDRSRSVRPRLFHDRDFFRRPARMIVACDSDKSVDDRWVVLLADGKQPARCVMVIAGGAEGHGQSIGENQASGVVRRARTIKGPIIFAASSGKVRIPPSEDRSC